MKFKSNFLYTFTEGYASGGHRPLRDRVRERYVAVVAEGSGDGSSTIGMRFGFRKGRR